MVCRSQPFGPAVRLQRENATLYKLPTTEQCSSCNHDWVYHTEVTQIGQIVTVYFPFTCEREIHLIVLTPAGELCMGQSSLLSHCVTADYEFDFV